jgi:hypothetical protein
VRHVLQGLLLGGQAMLLGGWAVLLGGVPVTLRPDSAHC